MENEAKVILDQAENLATQYGTPLFVYDGNKIEAQYDKLKKAFKKIDIEIHYALKALNNKNILKLLIKKGAGMDAVSIEEVHLALKAGCSPNEIMYTPNCVDFSEVEEAVGLGVKINIDNLSILEQFGNTYRNTYPCCIRINPHIMAGGHSHISVGHIDSKFGISIYQLRHVSRIVAHYNICINGIHMHTGSDILDAQVFINGAEILFEAAHSFKQLEFIDFGSGFKVSYKPNDIITDIENLAETLEQEFLNFCKEYGRNLKLCFEPGKFLVSEAGYLLVKANVIKQTTSTVFVGVNSGQNHLIRPMFYGAYHHITNASNMLSETKRIYSVVGYICETDTLGYDRRLNEVREGDILIIHNAGAYSFSMSNNYNARTRPAEVLVYNDKNYLIRKAETLDDIIKNELDIDLF
jgi:diaminopimelate decarboxylase